MTSTVPTPSTGLPVVCRLLGCDDSRHLCRPATAPEDGPEGETDPVLAALAHTRTEREEARTRLRLLLAYARGFTYPRPYTLASLAQATGMSISGIRTGYDQHDIATVAHHLTTSPTAALRGKERPR